MYLAQKTAACLEKYELGNKVSLFIYCLSVTQRETLTTPLYKLLTVCMDNASNNDTFTRELQKHFPTFGGPKSRLRCTAHIINLMAKVCPPTKEVCIDSILTYSQAFLSIFSKPTKRKQPAQALVTAKTGSKRQRVDESDGLGEHMSHGNKLTEGLDNEQKDATEPADDTDDSDTEELNEAAAKDNIDQARADHDDLVVQATVEKAFSDMETLYQVKIEERDRQMARQLIPKVFGTHKISVCRR
jgi:hypothetical protein